MKRSFYTLLITIACAWTIQLNAQTPFDSFAPETTRPMLELNESHSEQPDSILCALVADLQSQMLLLVDISNGEIVSSAPITDEIQKWLSVDPLADNYPGVSPYAYCLLNPVKNIDPDGRYTMENIDGGTDYKTILVLPSDQVLDEMAYKDRGAFLDTYQQARSAKMPTMRVDNAEDYANAMTALNGMNSSTDSYVLSTSHGYRKGTRLMIGLDMFTNKKGDFSQFRDGLSGKTVFITACSLAANQSGVDLIENFASATGSTIIGAEFPVPALLGGFRGGSLSNSPIRNAICNLFGGYCENSFKITNGVNTSTVYGLTIDKNRGIRWNCK